jgi:hypothetical protein
MQPSVEDVMNRAQQPLLTRQLMIMRPADLPSRFRSENSHGEGMTRGKGKQQQATNPLMGLGLPMDGVVSYYDLVFPIDS